MESSLARLLFAGALAVSLLTASDTLTFGQSPSTKLAFERSSSTKLSFDYRKDPSVQARQRLENERQQNERRRQLEDPGDIPPPPMDDTMPPPQHRSDTGRIEPIMPDNGQIQEIPRIPSIADELRRRSPR